MICDSVKNILPDMEVFISVEGGEERITFINDEYALVLVGNTSQIKVYCPDDFSPDGEYLIITFDLVSCDIMRHCYVLKNLQERIVRDLKILYEGICKIS